MATLSRAGRVVTPAARCLEFGPMATQNRFLPSGLGLVLGLILAADLASAQARPADPNMARALRALTAQPVVDGHNDLPWRIREDTLAPMDVDAYDLRKRTPGHTDLARLKQGRVGAQFWSIYIPGEKSDAAYKSRGAVASTPGYARVQLEQIDIARRIVAKYPELRWTLTADDVALEHTPGKDRLAARSRGWSRHRELAQRAAGVLRPRCALHDADAQRHAGLGRRRAGLARSTAA